MFSARTAVPPTPIGNTLLTMARRSADYLQLVQLLSDLDEAKVKLSTEVIGQSTVVVVKSQVSGANLAHPQLLLLETGGGHRVSVFFLRNKPPNDRHTLDFAISNCRKNRSLTQTSPSLTSASFFLVRTFSTSCSTFWASSTLPSAPSCSALAKSFPISSFSS